MQYPLCTAVPFQLHTHKWQLVEGVALLCLFGFLPNDTSSRDLHELWGSEPTTHTWAGKKWVQPTMRRSLKSTSVPVPHCPSALCSAGAPRSPQLSLPPSLCQLLEELLLHWGHSKTPPALQHPHSCNHPSLLQLSNWRCFDGLKPSDNLLIREGWYFIWEMKETFTGLCTPTILYHQCSLWIFSGSSYIGIV